MDDSIHNTATNGFYTPGEEQIVALHSILQKELPTALSLKEAQEIGIQLIALYECLARDRTFTLEIPSNDHF